MNAACPQATPAGLPVGRRQVPDSTTVARLTFPPAALPAATEELRGRVRRFLADEIAAGVFVPRCDTWLSQHSPEFSRKARSELRKIAIVYPGMSVSFVKGGFVLLPGGAPAIGSRPKSAQLS